jgi:DNA polymerase-2
MAHFNLSPETVGVEGEDTQPVPELGIEVDQERRGLVPETLRPLLDRRLELKKRLAELSPRDCRYKPYKARAQALKWLLVVCFGYLGYKNARFGRIESHQAVTAYSREILLRAKEVAEGMGLTVLHMYVDGLWVRKPGLSKASDFQSLVEAIAEDTHLHIALEGVYRWIVFLPSRQDERVPVPNRYFGIFQDGSLKMRGIEARRRDTPPWITGIQLEILDRLAQAPNAGALPDCLPGILGLLHQQMADLRSGRVSLAQLLVSQGLSRELGEYRTPYQAGPADSFPLHPGRAGSLRLGSGSRP